MLISQTPLVTARFDNPQYDCSTDTYCLEVEFIADTVNQEIFGINVRLFYDASILTLDTFNNYQGNYGPAAPNPPDILISDSAGPLLFGFEGAAAFVNGSVQKVGTSLPEIYLDTAEWTHIFSICFQVDTLAIDVDSFCPPVVWDLEEDPSEGGFLTGDDGLVITIVDPDPEVESGPAIENVIQFNWEYSIDTTGPYGEPVSDTCIDVSCSLPVDLVAFAGYEGPSGNHLQWETLSETGNRGFEIQRSFGDHYWTSLGYVPGMVNTSQRQEYSFIDRVPEKGKNYYRLKQIDLDGQYSYSPIINIVVKNRTDLNFETYPNPVTDGYLTVELSGEHRENGTLRIINSMGLIEKTITLQDRKTLLDMKDLHSGMYFIHILKEDLDLCRRVFIDNTKR